MTKAVDLETGIEEVTKLIKIQMASGANPVMVGLAGGSASGKTFAVTDRLKRHFGNRMTIVPIDDYLKTPISPEEAARTGKKINLDTPRRIKMGKLRMDLLALKRKKSIEKPVFDFIRSEEAGSELIAPRKIVLVEGLYTLSSNLFKIFDITVFVESSTRSKLLRRLMRDMKRTRYWSTHKEILEYFNKVVLPMERKYIQPTKMHAQIIIKNDFNHEIEGKSGEVEEIARKLGIVKK